MCLQESQFIFGVLKVRNEATGRGIYICILEWAKINNINLVGKTYILQGFGNVGSNVAILLSKLGMKLIAIGDHTGYYKLENGFDINDLLKYNDENKSLQNYNIGEKITRTDFFQLGVI